MNIVEKALKFNGAGWRSSGGGDWNGGTNAHERMLRLRAMDEQKLRRREQWRCDQGRKCCRCRQPEAETTLWPQFQATEAVSFCSEYCSECSDIQIVVQNVQREHALLPRVTAKPRQYRSLLSGSRATWATGTRAKSAAGYMLRF
ncbi:hypothetical protein LR48_Vigan07g153200 [Vigna angularis]|uniref:Uncharacterized protein n=1 Tax=Phaseolus angularis TaxID=3914 RepID=A0A0L9UYG9_PHAAN|nr:hypothetical protein LR48_Vigan07g153200 [Vigna angularis]